VGIAAGSNKVETIVAGARTGLLHVLITDEPTASAALRILGAGADAGAGARAGRTSEAGTTAAADRLDGPGPGTAV
jgi:hypothetical protein